MTTIEVNPFSGGSGGGDVSGPASSTDNAVARFNGTTGKTLQNSSVTIDNSGNISSPPGATVDGRDVSADGALLDAHVADLDNPHEVTKTQVGLGNVTDDAQLKIASNLSDLANATTARNNLSLGTSNTPQFAGLGINTAYDSATNIKIVATSSATKPLTLIGASGQSASLLTAQDSSSNAMLDVGPAGQLGIGASFVSYRSLNIANNLTGSANPNAMLFRATFNTDATGTCSAMVLFPIVAASTAFSTYQAISIDPPTMNSGATCTTAQGIKVGNFTTGGTNNYGIVLQLTSGSGKYNIYASGNADNYLAGNLGIGTTSPGKALDISGDIRVRGDTGTINFYRTTSPIDIAYIKYDNAGQFFDFGANNKEVRFLNKVSFAESMRITVSGLVGIGATSPGAQLDVRCVSASTLGIISRGATSQTANLFEAQNSSASILASISKDGAFVFNEQGADADCRIEGDTDANLFYTDASTDRIGVGVSTPSSKISVNGDIGLVDGMTAPSATVGYAKLYVDSADGDLKIIFGDGTIKTIATDT